jgi:hypothetical protein
VFNKINILKGRKMEYQIDCSIDIGKSISEVGELLKSINKFMKQDGFNEELFYKGKLTLGVLTTDRELTQQETEDIKTLIGGEIMKSELFKKFGIRVESISKSSKSCGQSYNATNVTNAQ